MASEDQDVQADIGMDDARREQIVTALHGLITKVVLDNRNIVEYAIDWGLDMQADDLGIEATPKRNGSLTLTLKIKGGAHGKLFPGPVSEVVDGESGRAVRS